ncbi:MAG: hypothetical protein JXR26_09175 [Balneolaceae bacterium]|nr:hypothetical protein [Balneolaceae bacterium]
MNNLLKRSLNVIALVLTVTLVAACGGNSQEETETQETDQMQTSQNMTGNESAGSDENMSRNATADAKLNINTATGEAFRSIPNVGDRMVHEFEEYRPYTSIQQFRREIGKYVDKDQVAEYEKFIYVPIHRNDSDAASLLQIPGLDKEEATELITNRPYESNQSFLDALSEHVSEEELATAEAYLKTE